MKLSILTATYNRANLLKRLYESVKNNLFDKLEIEWLIMDDGSNDETENVIQGFEKKNGFEIKYFKQQNQGKMKAINNLIDYSTGDLIVECDSDDYFTKDAFAKIYDTYLKYKDKKNIYGFIFLKYNEEYKNIGQALENDKVTTMFDLYFKAEENGEKALVFISEVRKKYKYELEKNEKFVTEASLFYRMDENYSAICINFPIMICEYQENGYTNNNIKLFKENPCGFFRYFEYLLSKDLQGVSFKKRLYIIKHYILFSYLSKEKISLNKIKNISSKIGLILLYIPGKIASTIRFGK